MPDAENGEPTWRAVPPPVPGCVCEATDYETAGPCQIPGHDSRVTAPECRCVPDDEVTARDADTGDPIEYVRVPGFWGWFRSGWRDVACPVHDSVLPPEGSDGA